MGPDAMLPTADQILAGARDELHAAYVALSDAADWLRSDWQPAGSPLTDEQAEDRKRMLGAIAEAKAVINRGKGAGRYTNNVRASDPHGMEPRP